MYNLSIGGHEILLVVQVFALAITMIPAIQRSLLDRKTLRVHSSSRTWTAVMHVMTLLSIATWWIADPLTRLALTGLANGFAAVLHAVQFAQAAQLGAGELQVKAATWLVGLLLSSLSKYANHSNNPLWPFMNSTNGGHHVLGLALASLALLEAVTRIPPAVKRRASVAHETTFWQETKAALGMGALLFALHTFLTDSGTMITWGWTGYPIKGWVAVQQSHAKSS